MPPVVGGQVAAANGLAASGGDTFTWETVDVVVAAAAAADALEDAHRQDGVDRVAPSATIRQAGTAVVLGNKGGHAGWDAWRGRRR